MEMLSQLGINITVGYQFAIYCISFAVFYFLIFKPYYNAFTKRVERTYGSQENSEKLMQETNELKVEFDRKTKSLNQDYKEIFDNQRTLAMEEYDSIMGASREKAKVLVEQTREKIKAEIEKTRTELKTHIPDVSSQVVEKLL